MSTDGTKPPSIAPKNPVPAGARTTTRPDGEFRATISGPSRPDAAGTPDRSDRPEGAPRTEAGTGPTDAARTDSPRVGSARPDSPRTDAPGRTAGEGSEPAATEQETSSPSMADRLKQAAQSAAASARNVLPTRDPDTGTGTGTDSDADERPSSPRGTVRPSSARDTGRPAPAPVRTTSSTTSTSPSGASVPAAATAPRKVRLAVARVDPWSIMKLAFLLSVAIGIMIVVAAAVVWYTLDELAVFTSVNETITEVTGSETFFPLLEFVAFDRVISLATMIAVVDVVLLTALSTIGAFLYNIVAALVGGIHLTLTDD